MSSQSDIRQIKRGNLIFDSENKIWVSKKNNKKLFNQLVKKEKIKLLKEQNFQPEEISIENQEK